MSPIQHFETYPGRYPPRCRGLLHFAALGLRTFFLLVLICLVPALISAQARFADRPVAITHVTLIDATGKPEQSDMTVIISGNKVSAIRKSRKVEAPRNTQVVDATGKFLIPGLWDMHVHVGNEEFDRTSYLRLFIANGVTGIRIMNGVPEHHLWRKEIQSGSLAGPRMFIASRIIDGPQTFLSGAVIVRNAAEGRNAVRQARKEGADFIKVHDNVPREAYFAVVKEAQRLGLAVEGHVPLALTVAEASNAGQKSIEHFTGLAEAVSDVNKADAIIAVLKNNKTWHCPTLVMRNNYALLDGPLMAVDARLKYVKPSWRSYWLRLTKEAKSWPAGEGDRRRQGVQRERELVGRMQSAGVGILAGTDDSNPFVIPGFSLHDELALLVQSGMTPMQVLQTATLNPARFFKQSRSLGTIETGKLADLVLLDANPLEDIRNTTRIRAVMLNGRWLDRESLNKSLNEIESAAKHQ